MVQVIQVLRESIILDLITLAFYEKQDFYQLSA